MDKTDYKINLDLKKGGVQCTLEGFCTGDTEARSVTVMLFSGTAPVAVPGNAAVTVFCAKPDGTVSYSVCEVDNGAIHHVFTSQETAAAGEMLCSIRVICDGTVFSLPSFRVIISEGIQDDGAIESYDEYSALTAAIDALPKSFVVKYSPTGEYDDENLEALNAARAAEGVCWVFLRDSAQALHPASVSLGRGASVTAIAVNFDNRQIYTVSTVDGLSSSCSVRTLASSAVDDADDNMPQAMAVAAYVSEQLSGYQTALSAGSGIKIDNGTISLALTDADGEVY